ncbi:hypothetical protein [Novosphingobium mangrovi (ex Huang et al. 2023)]|uniref:Uncharacterized protein n=1 Tax=Novosphingobium mangrovi (ex Huang et al. 2023) TaxID=2976432 RepID=A0ABT2I7P6_9SPHN|nr:hypothetical protein [Novosphingobium mangrovi (ex Huang et al. 2023)]MCT2400603.1 hypothetical protein [Novosphingobium mangrovi (ex Huang et al. 2023)]
MVDDHDPADTSCWPPEFLLSGDLDEAEKQLWMSLRIEIGLKDGNLKPLAEHLRRGFPLPQKIAEMIADVIERRPGAVCSITARKAKRGRQPDPLGQKREEYLQIGRVVDRAINSANHGEYEAALLQAAEGLGIGRTKAYQAHQTFLGHLKEVAGEVGAPKAK